MNDSKESDLEQTADAFLAQRVGEPHANGLAEKIILASRDLPQDLVKPVSSSVLSVRLRRSFGTKLFGAKSFVFSGAITCLMFLVVSGVWFFPQTGIVKSPPIAQNISIEGDVLSDEFSWDSLLIMQDELAFAEL